MFRLLKGDACAALTQLALRITAAITQLSLRCHCYHYTHNAHLLVAGTLCYAA
jgi:hypothetical protein